MSNTYSPNISAELIPFPIFIYDLIEKRIIYANGELENLSGYSSQEIQTKGIDYFHTLNQQKNDNNSPSCLLELDKLKPNERFSCAARMQDRAGRHLILKITFTAYQFKSDNEIIQVLGVVENITQSVASNKRLEERLDAACKRAESANRVKSLFLANMSHEIRTPMNALMGMCELLHETSLDEEQLEYLVTIKNSGRNLLNLLNDILDLSKIEANKLEIDSVSFNLHQWLQETLALFSSKIYAKQLEFICDEDENLPLIIESDPNRLRQILINLLSNAVKFTMSGEIVVSVSLAEQFSDGSAELKFSILDTGLGISEDKLNYIFDAFNQGSHSTARNFGGTGLGLTITKHLAKMMGGDLTVKSELGKGSTFTFTVKVNSFSLAPVPLIDWNKEKHALVIENPMTFSGLAAKLKRLEVPTVFAHTVDKALSLLEYDINVFGVVFIDAQWSMSQVDGMADKIIDLVNDYHLPLIIINSLGKTESYSRKLKFPAVRLFKPFMFHQLREKLDQVLQSDRENTYLVPGNKSTNLEEN